MAFAKSFDGQLRDELPNSEIFYAMKNDKTAIENGRHHDKGFILAHRQMIDRRYLKPHLTSTTR